MSEQPDEIESLKRVQNYNADLLAQLDRLGAAYEFSAVVEPAKELISIFQKIPIESLGQFPNNERNIIKSQADGIYNLFEQIMSFDAKQADAQQKHQQLVSQIDNQYQPVFSHLHPYISYAMARTVDFNELASQGRAAVQAVKDETATLMRELDQQQEEAKQILDNVRKVAAEQGVSQQAVYFAEESKMHGTKADDWQSRTYWMAAIVIFYGGASFFFHKFQWIAPTTMPETVQFVASKIVIFVVLAYMLFLSARNFLSHRHNEIVNKHRQNALMTYQALVDAAGSSEASATVLSHAASAIYQLHETGYARSGGDRQGSTSSSVVELMPKATMPIASD